MSKTSIRKKFSFAAVPDVVFSLRMKPATILVLAWALGRPDGWTFHICYMLKILNYSENQWRTAKKELMLNGFFNQKKYRDDQGKIHWVNEFCDDPLWEFNITPPSIPKKTIPDKTTDGGTSRGGAGDKAEDVSNRVSREEAAQGRAPPCENEKPAAASLDQNLKSKTACTKVDLDELMLPLLKNPLDVENWAALKAEFGDEALFAAIKKIIADGKKPFCSIISKLLRPSKTPGGASFSSVPFSPKPPGKLAANVLADMKAKVGLSP